MRRILELLIAVIVISLPTVSLAALNDFFVNTDWLAQNRERVVMVDVRKKPLYLLGHIEGALHAPRESFLETRHQVKSLVPSTTAMTATLDRLGITPDSIVVAYAEDDNPYAARFVWTLRYHGHKNSYVLDGGYDKWSAEGRVTSLFSTDDPQPSAYRMAEDAEYSDSRAVADDVYTRLQNPAVVIWDTRRDTEFAGTEVRADRGGHIPGAVHLNWTELQSEIAGVKVLKSRDEIVALLHSRGITPDKEIIAHCQTGIRSSYATLVLLGLGYNTVKNYDGSWFEWANDPTLPIVTTDGQSERAVKVTSN